MKELLYDGRVIGHVERAREKQVRDRPIGDWLEGMTSTRDECHAEIEMTIVLTPDGSTTDVMGALTDSVVPLVLGNGVPVARTNAKHIVALKKRIAELEKQLAAKAVKLVLPELDDG